MEHNIRYDQRYDTLAVVRRLESYTAAGEALSLTHSAVAQQIHSIEQELGVKLFNRIGKKLVPTRECDLVSEYVSQIHMLCRRMDDDLSANRLCPKHLVVGATPSVEGSVLSRVLSCYQAETGDVQITVLSESASQLYKMLRGHAVDLAVVEGEFPSDEFNSILLDTDHLVVAVASDSKYAQDGIITLEQLKREKLILRPHNSGTRCLFEANVSKMGISVDSFQIMMEIESVAAIKKLVAGGYGVSVLSNKACEKDVERGKFVTVPLRDVNMVRNIQLFYRKDFKDETLLRELRRLYESTAADE
ncbi:MAG: LysR family transcriptional regulator [Clostridia bacterium]|nr:LysR family transcriptional regulator [Clostridia bacterium]